MIWHTIVFMVKFREDVDVLGFLSHFCNALEQVGGPHDDYEDEGEGELDDEVVRDFHFGGGFVPKKQAEGSEGAEAGEDEAPERRRSKKEVTIPYQASLHMRERKWMIAQYWAHALPAAHNML